MAQEVIQQSILVDTGGASATIGELRQDFDATAASVSKTEQQFEVLNSTTNKSTAYLKQMKEAADATTNSLTTGMNSATQATKATTAAQGDLANSLNAVNKSGGIQLNTLAKQKVAFLDLGRIVTGQGFSLRSLASNFSLLGPELTIAIAAIAGLVIAYEHYQKTLFDTAKAQKELDASVAKNLSDDAGKVEILTATILDHNTAQKDRKKAIQELIDQHPNYYGNLKDDDTLIKTITEDTRKFISALEDEAKAKAISAKLTEIAAKEYEAQTAVQAQLDNARKLFNEGAIQGADNYRKYQAEIIATNKETLEKLQVQKEFYLQKGVETNQDLASLGGTTGKNTKTKKEHDNSITELNNYLAESQKILEDAEGKEITSENIKYAKLYDDLKAHHHDTEAADDQHEININNIHKKYADARDKKVKDAFAKQAADLAQEAITGSEKLEKELSSHYQKQSEIGDDARTKALDEENNFYDDVRKDANLSADQLEKLETGHRLAIQAINDKYDEIDEKKSLQLEARNLNQELAAGRAELQLKSISYSAKNKILDKETADVKKAFADRAINEEQYNKIIAELSKERIDIKKQEQQEQIAFANATADLLDNVAQVVGAQTAAGKDLAIAGALIKTYATIANIWAGATEFGPYGYALAIVETASAAAILFENIQKIENVNVPGASSSSSNNIPSSLGSSAGNFTAPQLPTQTNNTNLSAQSIQQINQANNKPVRAYVLESEISDSQQTVRSYRNASRIGH